MSDSLATLSLYIAQPRTAPVVDTAEVRRVLAESTFLHDHSGLEVACSMLRALLDEIDRLDGRVKALETRG